jgi:hypothetical protein
MIQPRRRSGEERRKRNRLLPPLLRLVVRPKEKDKEKEKEKEKEKRKMKLLLPTKSTSRLREKSNFSIQTKKNQTANGPKYESPLSIRNMSN